MSMLSTAFILTVGFISASVVGAVLLMQTVTWVFGPSERLRILKKLQLEGECIQFELRGPASRPTFFPPHPIFLRQLVESRLVYKSYSLDRGQTVYILSPHGRALLEGQK